MQPNSGTKIIKDIAWKEVIFWNILQAAGSSYFDLSYAPIKVLLSAVFIRENRKVSKAYIGTVQRLGNSYDIIPGCRRSRSRCGLVHCNDAASNRQNCFVLLG